MLFGVRPVGRGLSDNLDMISNSSSSINNSWIEKLKPVMELRSRVIAIKNIKASKGVGYGQRWVAKSGY